MVVISSANHEYQLGVAYVGGQHSYSHHRVAHKPFWQHHWVPAVNAARAHGMTKTPRIHDLRHTHASWLIQDGVMSLFAISRRLGHASIRTTEQVYGHLMPQALQDGADATERSVRGSV
ncbi:tyrosine-type recombinase/integrase [Arthrobacter globiformis]|uniref:tyrosine-type recombinase/integrase n=1 Tax=Arthrobacter globiformis TaxID=1665 RepID=UPI001CB934EC|nr:tyrosine-type recombinase/integrase [Arthrobacter globiformis]